MLQDVTGIEILQHGFRTATYSALSNETEEILIAVGDMDINEQISSDLVSIHHGYTLELDFAMIILVINYHQNLILIFTA